MTNAPLTTASFDTTAKYPVCAERTARRSASPTALRSGALTREAACV